MTQVKNRVRIVRNKLPPGALRAELKRNIERCESRYAVDSRKMMELLNDGEIAETDEILEWMQDFHVLRFLEEKTRTNGTRGTTIAPLT